MATPKQILDLPMGENDAQVGTVREYLIKLLADVWEYREGFNGKRPFGKSLWEYDLYTALGKAGFVKITLDEDGYIDQFPDSEHRRADELIASAIASLGECES